MLLPRCTLKAIPSLIRCSGESSVCQGLYTPHAVLPRMHDASAFVQLLGRSSVRTYEHVASPGKSKYYTPLFHLMYSLSLAPGIKYKQAFFLSLPRRLPRPSSPISSAFCGVVRFLHNYARRWLPATQNPLHNHNHHHHQHPPNQSLSLESSDAGMQSLNTSL